MIKHFLFITVCAFIGMLSQAYGTCPPTDHQTESSAVRNTLYYNYSRLQDSGQAFEQQNLCDDFNLPFLRTNWHSNSSNLLWTLKERPGYLRLKSKSGETGQGIERNTFSKTIRLDFDAEVVSLIDLSNMKTNDQTGLYLQAEKFNALRLEHIGRFKYITAEISNNRYNSIQIEGNQIVLKLRLESGKAWFEYSTDGLDFLKVGQTFVVNHMNLTQQGHVGLFCTNSSDIGGSVDVDWFYFKQEESTIQYSEVINK